MGTVLALDLVLRGAAAGFALLIAALAVLRGYRYPASLSLIFLGLGMVAYALSSTPQDAGFAPALLLGLGLLSAMNPALLWWAGLEFLEEAPPFRHWVPMALALMLGLGAASLRWPVAGLLRGVAMAGLFGHLLYIAWQSGPGDLVEARRQMRRVFLGLGASFGLVVTLVETGLIRLPASFPDHLLQAVALALLLGWFAIWLAYQGLVMPQDRAQNSTYAAPLTPAERAVLDRLHAAMTGGVWAEEGLSIGSLATRIDTSEHRLRRVINQGLGYRNFARFINEHRIHAAQAVLADPARADVPVLTIAYDSGFASLGPFNRAFRDITDQSPSEFRSKALSKPQR